MAKAERDDQKSELQRTAGKFILAWFGGTLPNSISTRDCVALMLQFSAWESQRANAMADAYKALINCTPMPPRIVSSTDWENLRPDGTRHRGEVKSGKS